MPQKAADLIRSWSHFAKVTTTPGFPGNAADWREALGDKGGALPPWLGIGRVVTAGNALYYHSALLIAFDLGAADAHPGGDHLFAAWDQGIRSRMRKRLRDQGVGAAPPGMHDVQIWLTKQLNLGGRNGIDAVRASGAKYWVTTHDEVKKGGGLISLLLRRTVYTTQDVADTADSRSDGKGEASGATNFSNWDLGTQLSWKRSITGRADLLTLQYNNYLTTWLSLHLTVNSPYLTSTQLIKKKGIKQINK